MHDIGRVVVGALSVTVLTIVVWWVFLLLTSENNDSLFARNLVLAVVVLCVGASSMALILGTILRRTKGIRGWLSPMNPLYDRPRVHSAGLLVAILIAAAFAVALSLGWHALLSAFPIDRPLGDIVIIFVFASVIVAFFVRDALQSIDKDYGVPARSLRKIGSYLKQAVIAYPASSRIAERMAVYASAIYNENVRASSRIGNAGVRSVSDMMARRGFDPPADLVMGRHTLTLMQETAQQMLRLADSDTDLKESDRRTYTDYVRRILEEAITTDALERTRGPPAVDLYRQIAVILYFTFLPLSVYSQIGQSMVVFYPILFLWVGGAYVVRYWIAYTLRFSDQPVFDYVRWIHDLYFITRPSQEHTQEKSSHVRAPPRGGAGGFRALQ